MSAVLPNRRLILIPGEGPEDIVIDREGRLIIGVNDGRILRVDPFTGTTLEIFKTKGRPLGLEVLPSGNILICDSPEGLLELDPTNGRVRTLVHEFEGQALPFCSNVVASNDGTIYFSSSTTRYTINHWRKDIAENIPTGALFCRYPDGRVEQLINGLLFANGLALAKDESWIVVAETGRYRLHRFWLKGPRAGSTEIFADLPGFPDNCSISADGLVWVAIAAPRTPSLEKIHRMPLLARKIIVRLPLVLQPQPQQVAWVMAFNGDGTLVHDYCWRDGEYSFGTGVCQLGDTVYMSSLAERSILSFELPAKCFQKIAVEDTSE
ncbi:SMP-30/gluconolactonase/LRE family protein [Pseudomonas yamanorum]|uniref:SMP-30/gluconolactonase/LRE family protein n=1 Tax=Pseudomonas yamanorum TaxID=515393 RepID=A0A7Y8FE97_9PSED|nr:SMP-30/gluconolactonase/LRE family protein [Pseudomonas yamanorum]NWE77792.1 SMP-30/gluconolactonase/LRE family protein [Pseudomonas yamanorum]